MAYSKYGPDQIFYQKMGTQVIISLYLQNMVPRKNKN